jgi:hypothetical protein
MTGPACDQEENTAILVQCKICFRLKAPLPAGRSGVRTMVSGGFGSPHCHKK